MNERRGNGPAMRSRRCSISGSRPSSRIVTLPERWRPRAASDAHQVKTIAAQPASQIANRTTGSARPTAARRGRGRRAASSGTERGLRERLTHRVDRERVIGESAMARRPPEELTPERDQRGERHEKLHRRRQPEPVAHLGAVVSQRQRQERGDREQRASTARDDCRSGSRIHDRHAVIATCPFSSSLRSVCSASCTSSSVSCPDSIRCAITGCVRPPKKLRRSSISRRWAALRETRPRRCARCRFS